jgi:hypothetical protein
VAAEERVWASFRTCKTIVRYAPCMRVPGRLGLTTALLVSYMTSASRAACKRDQRCCCTGSAMNIWSALDSLMIMCFKIHSMKTRPRHTQTLAIVAV